MNRLRARACFGLVAGVLTIVASACTRERSDTAQTEFFPLHADDTWVYEVARPLRNVRTRMTVRVRGERYIDALRRRAALVDESYAADVTPLGEPQPPAQPEVYPIAYYQENGFLYRAMSLEYQGSEVRDAGLGSGEERFLPNRLSRDLAWESVTTAYDLGGGSGYDVRQQHRAVSEPATVSVPAGQFSGCVRVDTIALHSGRHQGTEDSDPIVFYYSDWYAPNVGLVRSVQSNRPDGGPPLSEIALLAYDVEGARR